MVILNRSFRSAIAQASAMVPQIQRVLIAVIVISLGVLLGYFLNSPDTLEITLSVVAVLFLLLIIINKPLNGILIWLILVSFVETWVNIPMGAGIPDLTFSRFVIPFIAILLLAKAAIGQFRFAPIGLTEICIVAMTIGIISSSPLAVNPKGMMQNTISIVFTTFIIYFFTKNLVQSKEDMHKLFLAIVLFGVVAALYACFEMSTDIILFTERGRDLEKFDRTYTESLTTIRGLLGSSSNFGRVLIASIPITFYLFFEYKKSIAWKVLLLASLPLQFYALFLTYNRASWLSLLISFSFVQFVYPQLRRVYIIMVIVGAIAFFAARDQINSSTVVKERINGESTLEGREARWAAGVNMWKAKPIRGWGLGRYETESGRFRTDGVRENFRNGAIENDYLKVLISSGLIGFVPYVLLLLTPIVNSLRLYFKARAPDWSGFIKPQTVAIFWAVMLCYIITSYTQIQTKPVIRMITFGVTGAVIGSHEYALRGGKAKRR